MKTADFGRINTLQKANTVVCNRGAGKWNKSKEKRGILNFSGSRCDFCRNIIGFRKKY